MACFFQMVFLRLLVEHPVAVRAGGRNSSLPELGGASAFRALFRVNHFPCKGAYMMAVFQLCADPDLFSAKWRRHRTDISFRRAHPRRSVERFFREYNRNHRGYHRTSPRRSPDRADCRTSSTVLCTAACAYRTQMLGSILYNIVFVLGCSFLAGMYPHGATDIHLPHEAPR
jgi:hypothetical protein